MLLAVDTSTAQIGLALYDGAQVPGEFVWHSGPHHTQELAPALDELLKRAEVKISAITAIGVALGPGSFTSLRVGLAFVKGLALARHVPVIGVPTLEIVAAAVPLLNPYPSGTMSTGLGQHRQLVAVVQAGRRRLAVGWYRAEGERWQVEGLAEATTTDELAAKIHAPVTICGELSADDRQRLARKFRNVALASPAQCVRRPGILAELAWQAWEAGKTDAVASLAPIYLHVAGGLPA